MSTQAPASPDPNNLKDWFARDAAPGGLAHPDPLRLAGRRLGVVVGGSLSKGLDVKLDRETVIEDLAVGRYVVVRGLHKRFFCMITDVMLDATNPAIRSDPPDLSDPFLREIYSGTAAFGTLHVAPMLTIDEEDAEPRPVKTIPSHFMPVEVATTEDVERHVRARGRHPFPHRRAAGTRRDARSTWICGVWSSARWVCLAKAARAKVFSHVSLLAGVIKNDVAVNLIFDMHNDYGWAVKDEHSQQAKGLKQLFGSRVAIFTLDDEATRRRGASFDHVVTIGYDEIEPEDLAMLKTTTRSVGLDDRRGLRAAKAVGQAVD